MHMNMEKNMSGLEQKSGVVAKMIENEKKLFQTLGLDGKALALSEILSLTTALASEAL